MKRQKHVFENVSELEHKSQTFVSIGNVFKFITVCAAAGIVISAGAYEYTTHGCEIIGQWFYK